MSLSIQAIYYITISDFGNIQFSLTKNGFELCCMVKLLSIALKTGENYFVSQVVVSARSLEFVSRNQG